MPLPSQLWQQYRQHHVGAEDACAAPLPANKQTAGEQAAVGLGGSKQQGEAQGDAAAEEDEQYLKLLQRFEEQQGAIEVGAAATGRAAAAPEGQNCCFSGQLQMVIGSAGDDDEYAQCLQLLQEVEGVAGWATDTG
jgi:hypothetical protein